jgi:hypothetical protein
MIRVAIGLGYLGIMAGWFYGVWDRAWDVPTALGWSILVALAMTQLALGIAVARWWAVVLPLVAIVIAMPAGYGEGPGQEAQIWQYYGVLLAPFAVVLVFLGVGARKLRTRRS